MTCRRNQGSGVSDSRPEAAPLLSPDYKLGAPLLESDTLAALAQKLNLDAAAFERTVQEFNAAITDDVEYDASRPNGKSTVGSVPRHMRWELAEARPSKGRARALANVRVQGLETRLVAGISVTNAGFGSCGPHQMVRSSCP